MNRKGDFSGVADWIELVVIMFIVGGLVLLFISNFDSQVQSMDNSTIPSEAKLGSSNFQSKVKVRLIIDELSKYLLSLENTSKPINLREKIIISSTQVEFRELMDQLMSILPRAFVDLDLWFKHVTSNNDFDLQLSDENFGDGCSSYS